MNALTFNSTLQWHEACLAIGVGKEPRLGRWDVVNKAKNHVDIYKFSDQVPASSDASSEEEQ